MASRASVEFYVGLALKGRVEKSIVQEEAFVIRTFKNGLGVFVSKCVRLPSHMTVKSTGPDGSESFRL